MLKNSIFRKIKTLYPVVWFRVFLAKMQESFICANYLCISGIYSDSQKLKTHLTISAHALEKGMSIGKVRNGFGQPKALELIDGLQNYIDIGGEKKFANEASTIIHKYLEFNERNGTDMSKVKKKFDSFLRKNSIC